MSILIDRVHRISKPIPGKTRPIVVKFKDTASKMVVKNASKSISLKAITFNKGEQYPQKEQQRRCDLILVMIEARNQNKKAVLVRDKLFIDYKLYLQNNTQSSPHPASQNAFSNSS